MAERAAGARARGRLGGSSSHRRLAFLFGDAGFERGLLPLARLGHSPLALGFGQAGRGVPTDEASRRNERRAEHADEVARGGRRALDQEREDRYMQVQIAGHPVHASADLYSVGMMLFEAVAGMGRLPTAASEYPADYDLMELDEWWPSV